MKDQLKQLSEQIFFRLRRARGFSHMSRLSATLIRILTQGGIRATAARSIMRAAAQNAQETIRNAIAEADLEGPSSRGNFCRAQASAAREPVVTVFADRMM